MSRRASTLVISNSADVHVDGIVPRLRDRGITVFRLDVDAFPRDYALSYGGIDGVHDTLEHTPTGAVIALREVGSVWTRKTADFAFRCALAGQERAFARMEAEHALFGMLAALDCLWVNHPAASRAAMWKGEQLRRASRHGFATPATIITNRPDDVVRFKAAAGGDIVYKPLSASDLGASEVPADERVVGLMPTTIVDDDAQALMAAVAELPCLFQAYVAKQYEVRATVIGDRVFAARLDSQDDERTRIDSRDMRAPIRYAAIELEPALACACVALVASYGLAFGAIDLIVTPEGDVVFLEVNPAGQFLYVQQLVPELDMAGALADLLVKGCHG